MITQTIKQEATLCVCPECKNQIDISRYPSLAVGMVIECNHCGMTLLTNSIAADGSISTEIVDEGK